jgi:hypothetical protein
MRATKWLIAPLVVVGLLFPTTAANALPNLIKAHVRMTHVFRDGSDITVHGKAIYKNNRPHKNAIVSCEVEVHRNDTGAAIGSVEVTRHVPADSKRITKWTIEGTSPTSNVSAHRHNCHLI